MKREFLTTRDGSVTIHLPEWNEQYHSKHGAINEAKHVFINHGLRYVLSLGMPKVVALKILEIGFGTGLNALLSLLHCEENQTDLQYTAVEAFPVTSEEAGELNYPKLLQIDASLFLSLHEAPWEEEIAVTPLVKLLKRKQHFQEITDRDQFHLIYFDAFGARVQPELWTHSIFKAMFDALKPGGVLVTYSSKGSVRRDMAKIGFLVERLQGPPGKRHMLRGRKP